MLENDRSLKKLFGWLSNWQLPFIVQLIAWWLALFPGLAISIAVLGVNLLADAFSAARAAGGIALPQRLSDAQPARPAL